MKSTSIYEDIAERTGGDIYIGVVGPVRSGKSSFIKKFMESAVLPNIEGEAERARAKDELPQSAGGKTIMTSEPKFVPEKAVELSLGAAHAKFRMVDCVGFMVDGAEGMSEDGRERMVMTPWGDEPMPFTQAAEFGTEKVINEHSTLAVLVTTDGTIGELQRDSYIPAEERCVAELKETSTPFVIVLNSAEPESERAEALALSLEEKYSSPVALVSCVDLDRTDAEQILGMLTFEFPVREMRFELPDWSAVLPDGHPLREEITDGIRQIAKNTSKLSEASCIKTPEEMREGVGISVTDVSLGDGVSSFRVTFDDSLYYGVIREMTRFSVSGRAELLEKLIELASAEEELSKYRDAIDEVERVGYGIVMPTVSEMELDEPEIVKDGTSYGVRLRAVAPSIHLIKADIETEISPVVGTEQQSEELVKYLLSEFENDASQIWESNIFGKSLYDLVNEGLHTKLNNMPLDARGRLAETLSKIINDGSRGLICIIL